MQRIINLFNWVWQYIRSTRQTSTALEIKPVDPVDSIDPLDSIINDLFDNPNQQDIEAAIAESYETNPELCRRILKKCSIYGKWGTDSRYKFFGMGLGYKSLAIGWSLTQRKVEPKYLHALNTHYLGPKLTRDEFMFHNYYDDCYRILCETQGIALKTIRDCMMHSGEHGNIDMVTELVAIEPKLCARILEDGIRGCHESIIRFLASNAKSLNHRNVRDLLSAALYTKNITILNLVVEILGSNLTNDICQDEFDWFNRFYDKVIVDMMQTSLGDRLVK